MNISNLKQTLPILLKHNIVPFIWGAQGIGKTQSVSQIANKLGGGFIHLHLATQEVGDLVGLLIQNSDGTVKHARPEWFPIGGEGILFLDELNRASPDVLQAMFSLITSKTIHTHKLPDGWKIVAAGNNGDEFTVTDTSDAAWMSRFCHLTLEPEVGEFINFLEQRGHLGVADFVRAYPEMTSRSKRPTIAVTPDNRAWDTMVGPLETEVLDDQVRYELYEGILGATTAISYMNFRRQESERLKLSTILTDPEATRRLVANLPADTVRFDLLGAPLDELVSKLKDNPQLLNEQMVTNLVQFLSEVPVELLGQTVKKLGTVNFDHKMSLLNMPSLVGRFLVKPGAFDKVIDKIG